MDFDPVRVRKKEKVDGWREMVVEKELSEGKMVRVWEKRVLDQVRVSWVGKLQRVVW